MSLSPPKVFFLHIPKTAGTYINSTLAAKGVKVRPHIEALLRPHMDSELEVVMTQYDMISGHVSYNRVLMMQSGLGKVFRIYTALRNPISQLISNLSWQFEASARSIEFLQSHPESSRAAMRELVFGDIEDPSTLCRIVSSYSGYYLGQQSNVLSLPSPEIATSRDCKSYYYACQERLRKLDAFCLEHGIDQLIASIMSALGMSEDGKKVVAERNASRSPFLPSILNSDAFLEFTANAQLRDIILYLCAEDMLFGRDNAFECDSVDDLLQSFRLRFPPLSDQLPCSQLIKVARANHDAISAG